MRRKLVYGVLALVWLVIAGWQTLEHQRVLQSAKNGLANRAHDLAAALSVVIRSQGRIALVPKPRLEAALYELIDSTELQSAMLLNASGEVTASAGQPISIDMETLLRTNEFWSRDSASFVNLVALGPGTEGSEGTAGILALDAPPESGGPGPGPHGGPGRGMGPRNFLHNPMFDSFLDETKRQVLLGMIDNKPLTLDQVNTIISLFPEGTVDEHHAETLRQTLVGRPLDEATLEDTFRIAAGPMHGPRQHGPGPPPEQPPWMNKGDYDQLVQEHGVHWFLVTIPTTPLRAEVARDLRLRGVVLGVALLACIAFGLAWRTFERSSSLEIQLVRARDTANHLQELNITAAGLVHETKNPLNLIRGLAQMISREPDIPDSMRNTAMTITDEADRVTGRLNQFLAYARPLQPNPKKLNLSGLVKGLFEILACDREDKSVAFELKGPELSVKADENMLRQTLFNLLMNALQAVPNGGCVEVDVVKETAGTASLYVRDNGPGIPPENREEVFRPYFTASEKGTGLGLAIVRQIALAHNWEVACVSGDGGAVFRIRGIALAEDAAPEAEHG